MLLLHQAISNMQALLFCLRLLKCTASAILEKKQFFSVLINHAAVVREGLLT